jgi:uncharacterized protein (TIGR02679 family)
LSMDSSLERAVKYFEKAGFQQMLMKVWKRYESLERVGGEVVVKRASAMECEAINSFFGWNYKTGQSIPIPLEVFERELMDSPFPNTIVQLHYVLSGKILLTKSEKRMLREQEWLQLFIRFEQTMDFEDIHPFVNGWLGRLKLGEGQGYRTLYEQFKLNPDEAGCVLDISVRAVNTVLRDEGKMNMGAFPLSTIRLPVLAVQICGDSHALDLSQPAGRMLLYALRERQIGKLGDSVNEDIVDGDMELSFDSLKIREIYRSAGIADDDLSSLVYTYMPVFREAVQPAVWTLRQIEIMTEVPVCTGLYVVENPAVFSTLLDVFAGERGARKAMNSAMLICTSGPASAAALRLIQRILERSDACKLHYSGDYDLKGLSMGLVLYKRFKAQFVAWRFDLCTYRWGLENGKGPAFYDSEKTKLQSVKIPWDPQLNSAMIEHGHKVFQECFVSLLAQDWMDSL